MSAVKIRGCGCCCCRAVLLLLLLLLLASCCRCVDAIRSVEKAPANQELKSRNRLNTSPVLLQLNGILSISGVTMIERNLSIGLLTDRVVATMGRAVNVPDCGSTGLWTFGRKRIGEGRLG